ncbi:MAG: PAS domain-containing protein [Spirochaeta sp.]|jgi:PAS domain-containing protein|nr:PAS domain-containing protein [Spirochaeta sp.]
MEGSVFFAERSEKPDCTVQRAFETRQIHTTVAPFPWAEDPQRWFAVSAFPITDSSGTVINVIESGRDISELKKLQDSLAQAVEEKDLLLKEVHHRVG